MAGVFAFDNERNVQTFTFTDQMVNVEDAYYNGQSSHIVTQTVQRIMKDVFSPTAFRLTHSAALMVACSVRNAVHIAHADGVATILRFVVKRFFFGKLTPSNRSQYDGPAEFFFAIVDLIDK